jgi:hypothetical protein
VPVVEIVKPVGLQNQEKPNRDKSYVQASWGAAVLRPYMFCAFTILLLDWQF